MLVMITAEQIAANWEFLKTVIVESSGLEKNDSPQRMNNILNSLLCGDLQLWTEASISLEGTVSILGVVVTQVLANPLADVKNLLIYSAVSVNNALGDQRLWIGGLKTLAQYARKKNCKQIIAYTQNESLIKLCKRLGGETEQRLIVFTLN